MEKINNETSGVLSYNTTCESNWTNYISKELKWLNNVNTNVDGDSEDIVERFTSMSNINRSYNRKADREEIRKRLATGSDSDDYYNGERINRKPSLQTRLQSGMNLQICFMNENTSDNESINSDSEVGNNMSQISNLNNSNKSLTKRPDSLKLNKFNVDEVGQNYGKPVSSFPKISLMEQEDLKKKLLNGSDFFTCQAQLQAEARLALAQAKEMAQMQIELEKQRLKVSPITDMIRKSLEKVGVPFPEDRRRLSRQILTEMNIAQLQIIANDLHSKIEELNEKLVRYLIGRDDMHMEQDSMLVDIEDLTRYLHANRYGT